MTTSPFQPFTGLMLDLAENMELPASPDGRAVVAPLMEYASLLGFNQVLNDLFGDF